MPLPPEAWDDAYAFEAHGEPGVWTVIANLWGKTEGRTDMSLEALVREGPAGVKVSIHDLHVT